MQIKVSDLIARFWENQGVENIFLLSGGMMMHLLDSISKSTKIRYICNHHEQASAMAAEGNARWRCDIGVCYATSGPGATNTITGIAGAWLDSSPVVFITGQCRTTLTARGIGLPDLRMLGTFEVDIVSIVEPITKYTVSIDDPRMVLYHLQKALWTSLSDRPGPVLLDIPLDIQGAVIDDADLPEFTPPPPVQPPQDQLIPTFKRLAQAQRPVLLAGHGVRVAGESERFLRFAENLGIPIVTTQLANDLVPFAHPLFRGHVGLRGDRSANFTVQGADFVLVVGSSLHITTTGYDVEAFAPSATKAWIDSDQVNLKRNHTNAEFTLALSVKDFLDTASRTDFQKAPVKDWISLTGKWKQALPISDEHPLKGDQIETYQMINVLSDVMSGNETIVTDAGSLYYVVGQALKVKKGQRVIVSGALGSMGFALPASLGISVENQTGPTICLTGDGSTQTNVQELATIARYQPNLKIIVINNTGYASIRNSQVAFCDGNIAGASPASGVTMPDWETLCSAYGIPHSSVNLHSGLIPAFENLLSTSGPAFLEIQMDENVEMFPAVTSRKLDDGSFVSSKLHEMSPQLSEQQLRDLRITAELVSWMNGHSA